MCSQEGKPHGNQIILFMKEKCGMAEDSQSLLAKQDTKNEDSSKAVYVRYLRWGIEKHRSVGLSGSCLPETRTSTRVIVVILSLERSQNPLIQHFVIKGVFSPILPDRVIFQSLFIYIILLIYLVKLYILCSGFFPKMPGWMQFWEFFPLVPMQE